MLKSFIIAAGLLVGPLACMERPLAARNSRLGALNLQTAFVPTRESAECREVPNSVLGYTPSQTVRTYALIMPSVSVANRRILITIDSARDVIYYSDVRTGSRATEIVLRRDSNSGYVTSKINDSTQLIPLNWMEFWESPLVDNPRARAAQVLEICALSGS